MFQFRSPLHSPKLGTNDEISGTSSMPPIGISRAPSAPLPVSGGGGSNTDRVPMKLKQGRVRRAMNWVVSLTQSGIRKDYELLNEELGKGKYGVVRPAVKRKTGEKVAVKILPKVSPEGKDEVKFAMREIAIMERIDHPNCVAFYGTYESSRHIYIVMELVTGGQLLERIVKKDHYSETEAAKVFVQVVRAIEYMHSKGVVHRDLKPENLLYKTKEENSQIKVCDFGLGRAVAVEEAAGGRSRFWSRCGSPDYVAPEVLMRNGYGMECDVWSAGVILYIMLCGTPPFGHASVMIKFDRIKKGMFAFPDSHWAGVSEEAKDMVSCMLNIDPRTRHTCKQALEHPWLKRLASDQLPTSNMPQMQKRLREWNAGRKLIAAIHTVTALHRMTQEIDIDLPSQEDAQRFLEELKEQPEKLDELRQSFSLLDRDGTGCVRVENLAVLEKVIGHKKSPKELNEMLQHFDVYHKGYVDFDEYCIMMAAFGQSINREFHDKDRTHHSSSSSGGGAAASHHRSSGHSDDTSHRPNGNGALAQGGRPRYNRNDPKARSMDNALAGWEKDTPSVPNRSGSLRRFDASTDESVMLTYEDILSAFKALDVKHCGTVTPGQLRDVFVRFGASVSLQEAEEMVAMTDRNGDGKIDAADLWQLIQDHDHAPHPVDNTHDFSGGLSPQSPTSPISKSPPPTQWGSLG
mmetsp:Transcript_20530/g.51371  ORF Transcript_20530/g.51371 Transcript_20530/m.51371 type:complete len:689 (-) Transcript_20530:168-2234(-)